MLVSRVQINPLIIALLFACIMAVLLISVRASSALLQFETEKAQLSDRSMLVSAGDASGGSYIKFGLTATGGTLSFTRHTIDPKATAPKDIHSKVMADANGDGFLDLVVGSASKGGIVWYEYPSWTKHTIESGSSFSTDMDAGDIDGDGDTDMLIPRGGGGGNIVWFENPLPTGNPNDEWQEHAIGPNRGHDVMPVDLDNDGDLDVLARGGEIGIFRNNGNGTSWTARSPIQLSGEGISFGDLNGDGFADIVASSNWFENPDGDIISGNWKKHTFTTNFGGDDTSSAIGDLNNDGRNDIFLSNSEGGNGDIAWFEAPTDPTQTWTKTIIDSPSPYVHSMELADFNRDGHLDLVMAEMHQSSDPDEVNVYVNNGNASGFTKLNLSNDGSHNLGIGDIGNDGDIDVFGANWNSHDTSFAGPVEFWENNFSDGGGGGSDPVSLDSWNRFVIDANKPHVALFVEHGDLNGDGRQDVIAGGYWYPNPGSAAGNWVRTDIGPGLGNAVAVYDFDNDGDLDLFGTKANGDASGGFNWAQNDGSGNFTVHENIQPEGLNGDFLQGVTVARFGPNQSGPLSIAISWHRAEQGVQMITVPANPASQTWTWQQISSSSQDEHLSTGDIDGDGDLDISMGTKWLQNNNGSWAEHTLFSPTGKPDRNKLIDIDKDGDVDSVVGYEAISKNGTLAWYENPGGANATNLWTEHVVATIIGPMSLDVADMDDDGDLDIITGEHFTNNPASAKTYVFENDGTAINWIPHVVYTGDEHHVGTQTADFDGDGILDITSIGWVTNTVTLYINND